jgi:transcriptional regulator with XRE-family HTH domain
MKQSNNAVGGAIRARRRELGLTQVEVAISTGVHGTYVGAIERGAGRGPSTEVIGRLAHVLKMDRNRLLALAGRTDPKTVAELAAENERLRSEVNRLEQRIRGLEALA